MVEARVERQLKACRREIAHVRERLVETIKHQTATSEMLRVISDSPIQSVLDVVAEHAARLCDSTLAARKPFRNFVYHTLSGNGSPMYVRASGKRIFCRQ
jgi:hypothetical protein